MGVKYGVNQGAFSEKGLKKQMRRREEKDGTKYVFKEKWMQRKRERVSSRVVRWPQPLLKESKRLNK